VVNLGSVNLLLLLFNGLSSRRDRLALSGGALAFKISHLGLGGDFALLLGLDLELLHEVGACLSELVHGLTLVLSR
jgi:hypothetical protein